MNLIFRWIASIVDILQVGSLHSVAHIIGARDVEAGGNLKNENGCVCLTNWHSSIGATGAQGLMNFGSL
jgi:hypothetical protein